MWRCFFLVTIVTSLLSFIKILQNCLFYIDSDIFKFSIWIPIRYLSKVLIYWQSIFHITFQGLMERPVYSTGKYSTMFLDNHSISISIFLKNAINIAQNFLSLWYFKNYHINIICFQKCQYINQYFISIYIQQS